MKRVICSSVSPKWDSITDDDMELMNDAVSWVVNWQYTEDVAMGNTENWALGPIIRVTADRIQISDFWLEDGKLKLDSSKVKVYSFDSELQSYLPSEVIKWAKDRKQALNKLSDRKPGGAGVYTFFVCNNEVTAMRGMTDKPDTFDQYRKRCASEDVAMKYAAYLIYGEDWEDWGDAKNIVEDQDPGGGWPVVYGIKKGTTWIYKDFAFDDWEAQRKGELDY